LQVVESCVFLPLIRRFAMISKSDFAKQVLARTGKATAVAASAGLVLAVPMVPTPAKAWPTKCMPLIPISEQMDQVGQLSMARNLLGGMNARVMQDPGFVEISVDFVENFHEYLRACDESDFLSQI
jgi:hypothetical protein